MRTYKKERKSAEKKIDKALSELGSRLDLVFHMWTVVLFWPLTLFPSPLYLSLFELLFIFFLLSLIQSYDTPALKAKRGWESYTPLCRCQEIPLEPSWCVHKNNTIRTSTDGALGVEEKAIKQKPDLVSGFTLSPLITASRTINIWNIWGKCVRL